MDDIGWAAGLFEGEGCISVQRPSGHVYPQLALVMTDEDVVRRFADVVEVGHVYKVKPQAAHHRQAWKWHTGKRSACEHVMELLLPHLGARRSARWDEVKELTNA